MTPETLKAVGEALYGRFWQSAVAHDLRVSDRTVRRWLGGDKMPDGVSNTLYAVCLDKVEALHRALEKLTP